MRAHAPADASRGLGPGHLTGHWRFNFSVAENAPVSPGTLVTGTVTATKVGDPSQTRTDELAVQVGTVAPSCTLSVPNFSANVPVSITRAGPVGAGGVTLSATFTPLMVESETPEPAVAFIPPVAFGSGASMIVYANGRTNGRYRVDVRGTMFGGEVSCTDSGELSILPLPQ